MENFRRTLYGAVAQTCQYLGLPIELMPNSTLNEKFNIHPTAQPGVNEMPRMRYLAIGINGHRSKKGADNMDLVENVQHTARDAALYKHIPFVLRPVDSDLTPTERERYGLRRIEAHGGVDYIAYYLRRLDLTNVVVKPELRTVVNNVTTTTDFLATSDDLSPTPPDIDNNGVNTVTGQYLSATARIDVQLDTFDATEILAAAMIIYGKEDYAFISELAFVTGCDRTVQTQDANNNSFNYNEVIYAQVSSHVASLQPLKTQRDGFKVTMDVGCVEPMFTLVNP